MSDIDEVTREKDGITEMLGLVLFQVGEPVVINKSLVKNGLGPDYQISIEENPDEDAFIFSLVKKLVV